MVTDKHTHFDSSLNILEIVRLEKAYPSPSVLYYFFPNSFGPLPFDTKPLSVRRITFRQNQGTVMRHWVILLVLTCRCRRTNQINLSFVSPQNLNRDLLTTKSLCTMTTKQFSSVKSVQSNHLAVFSPRTQILYNN